MRNKKGAIEFSFAWIFAILAGLFILFLAIYGVVKFIGMQRMEIDAQTAKDIGVLTNPLESGFETSKRVMIITPAVTRIYTDCDNESIFGTQTIRTSEEMSKGWSEDGINVPFQNKYIYSKNPVEGTSFYLFSKPLEVPFKVADLIYLTATEDKYCFVNPPEYIEEEIEDLRGETVSKNENLVTVERKRECGTGNITVCFNTETCDVTVNINAKRVTKSSGTVWYEGDALMYAAIFSSKKDYECQIDRLMNRTEQLYEIYKDKADFVLKQTGCNSALDVELIQMLKLLRDFQDSEDLSVIYILSDEIDKKNEYAECRLW